MDMWHVVGVMWTKTTESTRNHRSGTPSRKLAVARVHGRPGQLGGRPHPSPQQLSARGEQRACVQWLVEPESAAAGQFDGGDEPPALPRHAVTELDALRCELAYGRLDVVAHQVELIAAAIRRCRVRGQLRRGQREDEPAAA